MQEQLVQFSPTAIDYAPLPIHFRMFAFYLLIVFVISCPRPRCYRPAECACPIRRVGV
jgi:hypothetical protein